jgi:hypothetical protein
MQAGLPEAGGKLLPAVALPGKEALRRPNKHNRADRQAIILRLATPNGQRQYAHDSPRKPSWTRGNSIRVSAPGKPPPPALGQLAG